MATDPLSEAKVMLRAIYDAQPPRFMLVSPKIAALLEGFYIASVLTEGQERDVLAFSEAFRAAPCVRADDDAIRWLRERQGGAS